MDIHEISGSQCGADEDSELLAYDAILTGKQLFFSHTPSSIFSSVQFKMLVTVHEPKQCHIL
jgi:hypothetical protein